MKTARRARGERGVQAGPGPLTMAERFRGCLLGLAAGDALGAANEFKAPGTFRPVDGGPFPGGGPFRLKPGEWTDDTSCALCLGESLAERGGLDAADAMGRLLRWREEGYLSSNGRCFDIGPSTGSALERFRRTGVPWQGRADSDSNGCLMRLAPVPLFFFRDGPLAAIRAAEESARLTHGHPDALAAARYLAALLVGCLQGRDKAALAAEGLFNPTDDPHLWARGPLALTPAVRRAVLSRGWAAPRAGYDAVSCLRAALWAFREGEDFTAACCLAANLGEDSDTAGAVAGQLAGACWGEAAIPPRWRATLVRSAWIGSLAERLLPA